MNFDSKFNKLLNNLDKVVEKNGGNQALPQITESDKAEWAVKQINGWLDEGILVKIVGNKLQLVSDNETEPSFEQFDEDPEGTIKQIVEAGEKILNRIKKDDKVKI